MFNRKLKEDVEVLQVAMEGSHENIWELRNRIFKLEDLVEHLIGVLGYQIQYPTKNAIVTRTIEKCPL